MKLQDFIHLAKNVKLYKTDSDTIWTKDEVMRYLRKQVERDIMSGCYDKETKERVKWAIQRFEAIPPKAVLQRHTSRIFREMRLT